MAQGNGNFKHYPEPSILKQATNQPCLPQKLSESQGPPKVYKNMLQIGNTTNPRSQYGSPEFITKSVMEKNGVNDKSLDRLRRQIHQLQTDDSRQAYLRYESQAFMIRKKRNNLFRVSDKMIPQSSLTTTSRLLTFDMKLSGKKPGNKNAIKLQKLLKSFFEDGLQDSTDNRFLQFILMKHKLQLEEDEIKNTKSPYYTESEISRIKKYFVNPNKLPFMGIQFDFQNNEDDVSQLQKIVESHTDYNEENIDCFLYRPDISGYIIPQTNLFLEFLTQNKKQLFKGAKLLNRLRTQKEGILKRIAYQCVKQVDKRYKKCLKHQNDFINRAKKIHRQSLLYWRKRDKDLNELKKKKQKIQAQIKRKNEEKQQEQTQKKKLQYLMKQSVLYSHFMAKKLGMQSENNQQLFGQESDKKIDVDNQAAELNVNQMISKKMDKLQKFDNGTGDNLDLSKVDVQDQEAEITGPPKIFIGKLKDYQVKGLKWLYNLNLQGINGILADEMGLGKTIQAIALLSHISYTKNKWGPFLIVSPSSTLHNWQQQFGRFCPTLKILPYWGNIKQRKVIRKYFSTKKFTSKHDSHFHVVITSYQMAVMDEKTFKRIKWQFIILDEAHNIKNTMSQRWNVLKEFQSRSRLLLTGTPIQNNMAQLWALLNFIMPQLFDSHEQFNEWFSKDIQAHSQDQKELDKIQIQRLHAILKPFMLRRVKKDVEHEIGKKFENRILCEMTKRQKILYQSIKEKLNVKQLFKMLQSKSKVENLMNLVMQLRKVCNHPELFQRRPPNSPYMFQQIYYYTGSTPIKNNDFKIITYNSINPIRYYLPILVYEDLIRKQQRLDNRNKRMLNLYEPNNIRDSKGMSCLYLMKIGLSLVQKCFREDILYTGIILLHTLNKNIKSSLSINEFINLPLQQQCDNRFRYNYDSNIVDHLKRLYIPIASAPTIIPIVTSASFYNIYYQISNNNFQKYIMQGKYKQDFQHIHPIPNHQGLLPKDQFLTKIQLVNFGSLIADSAKLKQLDKILKQKRANGDKVLIFCQMTRMLDILQDFMNMKKYPFFRLDGACSLSDRRDMVNQFQKENSRVFAFLLSTRAGGLGVTLTAANNVIFYDNDWNPTMDAQATDRAHRIGQTRDVYVYQLVTMGTIEDRIVKRAQQKKTVQSTVYEGAALNIFKKDMIMQLMADELGVQQNEENKKQQVVKKRGPKATKPTIGITKQKITA